MTDFLNNADSYKEDPLETLLDEESTELFGEPKFNHHFDGQNTPVILQEWTAKEFASIYVRFRPHLERHAKRFLVNPSQVEEVVQDAFLYLMTTLPELDSEVGVLRFLKWKTRLLALDVIRANSRVSIAPLEDQPEFAANLPEVSQDIERADDAAIVSLALAKLPPRHREALIASLYEEKSAAEVSAQMGLSENAFRQLLFRARSSFKTALIGEAEASGLTVSQILSLAARKAAKDSGKYISAAGAFLLVLAVSIGVLPNIQGTQSSETVLSPVVTSEDSMPPVPPAESEDSEPLVEESSPQLAEASTGYQVTFEENLEPLGDQAADPTEAGDVSSGLDESSLAKDETTVVEALSPEKVALAGLMRTNLGDRAVSVLAMGTQGAAAISNGDASQTVTVSSGSGLSGTFTYNFAAKNVITQAWFTIKVNGQDFIAVPQGSYSERTLNADKTSSVEYISTGFAIGDVTGDFGFVVVDDSEVSLSAIRVTILFDASGRAIDAHMNLSSRN